MKRSKFALAVSAALFLSGFLPVSSRAQTKFDSLTVAVTSLTYGHAPLFVAQRKGFYAREGLQVDLPVMESGSRAAQALLGGSAQLTATTPEDLIRAVEAGTSAVMLAGVINGLTHSLMANPKFKRIGDLRGGKIAASSVAGSVTYALKLMLAKNELQYPKDYLIIQIGGSGMRWAALKGGGIDAALVAEPLGLMAEEAGLSNLGFVGDYLPHLQVTVVAAKSDWAKANRSVVVRYLKALVRTYEWLYNNKEDAIDVTAAVIKTERKFGARGYDVYTSRKIWPQDGSPSLEGITAVLDYMREAKILSSSQRPEKYVDSTYLNEAIKELK